MSRKTSTQILSSEDTPEAGARPYLDQTQAYRVFLQQKLKESQRAADDLRVEIDGFESQIQSRMLLLDEHNAIISMSQAALAVEVKPTRTAVLKNNDRNVLTEREEQNGGET